MIALSVSAAGVAFGLTAVREQAGATFVQTRTPTDPGLIAFTASKPEAAPEGQVIIASGDHGLRPTWIYVARPDGSNRRRLTGASLMKGSLAWSPDGAMLAFTTYDPDRKNERLSIMSRTGADRHVFCKDCTATFWVMPEDEVCIDWCDEVIPFSDRLAWSPDGRWLAAPRAGGGLSLIRGLDGQGPRHPRSRRSDGQLVVP